MYKRQLEPRGAEFRNGLGVSGRTANFLGNNPDRIIMAYSVLLSLPGIPIIYYGDEIAAQNNFSYAKKAAKSREQNQKRNKIRLLSFFDLSLIHIWIKFNRINIVFNGLI